jgi:hypothetical protein
MLERFKHSVGLVDQDLHCVFSSTSLIGAFSGFLRLLRSSRRCGRLAVLVNLLGVDFRCFGRRIFSSRTCGGQSALLYHKSNIVFDHLGCEDIGSFIHVSSQSRC